MQHGKLVRDRIPEIIKSSGRKPEVLVLHGDELLSALLDKLEEETQELRSAPENQRTEELADILEVVRALADKLGMDMTALEQVADSKRAERGSFDRGLWLVRPL
ncbi:MAG: nucleoside triphosphate pyrophosphohydrolase [Mycobacterium sp.]